MKVKKVDNIKDGNKAARREYMYGGGKMKKRMKYADGGMPKAKPC